VMMVRAIARRAGCSAAKGSRRVFRRRKRNGKGYWEDALPAHGRYRSSPYFDRTGEFCALYDEVSFDAAYPSEPMSTFEPMVRRVLSKDWTPPR
jgi:hypothetical protein